MKKKALQRELEKTRAELADLLFRHEQLCRTITQLQRDHEHLTAALAQRGIWDHDYRDEKPRVQSEANDG